MEIPIPQDWYDFGMGLNARVNHTVFEVRLAGGTEPSFHRRVCALGDAEGSGKSDRR